MRVPFATIISIAEYVAVALCGLGVSASTGLAILSILYFRSVRRSRIASALVGLLGSIAALLVAVSFGMAFGFVASLHRGTYTLIAIYMAFTFGPILAVGMLHKKLSADLISKVRSLEQDHTGPGAA
jgi:K+-sensing histidine kinase KdpD